MVKPADRETKKPYATPVLTIHGTVRDLTKANQAGGKMDKATHGFRVRTAL